jgi:hypothetical protein
MATKKVKDWLTRAKAAKNRGDLDALFAEVTVLPLTERQARALRSKFTKKGEDGQTEVNADAMTETLIGACCVVDAPLSGREDELLDLPASLYQRMAAAALAVNGYAPDTEGNA